ncbi:uncharacterized protein LOC109498427 isoform X2 [Felis catus]|uniref:uncharacterized protein LOC109498427 isoform X2 n=1 Tax=Felis catus TaxID=9685 RepID=UPI001D19B289|nr:uncharacterized protein LOC109498427 isoform X2 [Felis catus]
MGVGKFNICRAGWQPGDSGRTPMWQSWEGCLQYIWLFSHFQFWRPEFKVRVSAGLVPSEGCEGFTEVDCEPQGHSRCLWFELARGLAGSQEAQVSWMSSGQALGPGQPSLPGNTWPGPGKNPPASLPGTWAIHLRAQARPPVRPAPCAAQTPFLSLTGKCRALLHPAHHHTDFAGDKRGLCGTEVSRDLSVPIGCW